MPMNETPHENFLRTPLYVGMKYFSKLKPEPDPAYNSGFV